MARGWESKSVEMQMESADKRSPPIAPALPTAEQTSLVRERDHVRLSRIRVERELRNSTNSRYRKILDKALADLNTRLGELDQQISPLTKSS